MTLCGAHSQRQVEQRTWTCFGKSRRLERISLEWTLENVSHFGEQLARVTPSEVASLFFTEPQLKWTVRRRLRSGGAQCCSQESMARLLRAGVAGLHRSASCRACGSFEDVP